MRLKQKNLYRFSSFTVAKYLFFFWHFCQKWSLSCFKKDCGLSPFLGAVLHYLSGCLHFILFAKTQKKFFRNCHSSGWVSPSNSVPTWTLTIKIPSAPSGFSSNVAWKYHSAIHPFFLPSSYQPILLTRYRPTDGTIREFIFQGWQRAKAQCLLWFSAVVEY